MDAVFGGELDDGLGLLQELLHEAGFESGTVSLIHNRRLPDPRRPDVQFLGSSIRARATRSQRVVLHSWAFHQLRSFLDYKARLVGVVVVLVDPRNTSRACSQCGHIDKANRKSQAAFVCTSCSFAANADVNAAVVISRRAGVMLPHVSTLRR
ncbi:MAG: transposase [Chloroflexota bacterium]|nr:transposase [Chloroflexota bacterium]